MDIIYSLKYLAVFLLLGAASYEDIKTKKIPNKLILFGLVTGLVFMASCFTLAVAFDSILGFLAGGGIFLAVSFISRNGIGMGDVKLMACTGLFLGLGRTLECIAISIILCGIFGVVVLFLRGFDRKATVPFAPFILLATLTMSLQSIIS